MRITKTYRFEASHVLPEHKGKCANVHGHSYKLEVTIAGHVQTGGPASGMVMDFDELSEIVKQHVVEKLDHSHLNDTLENPTCEEVVLWIWFQLKGPLPLIDTLTLWETETSRTTVEFSDAEVT